jgi:hypothetical protein
VRALASALAAVALGAPAAPPGKVAFRAGNRVVVLYLRNGFRQPIVPPNDGPLHWSGDGRLLSIGGTILGRAKLPTADVAWAPTGERAAYVTARGAVWTWSPRGRRLVVPAGWGAQRVAWSRDGRLAIGRAVCHAPCGLPTHVGVWTWDGRALRRVVGPLDPRRQVTPMPLAWSGGRVLWWAWPDSGSVAADGVALHANAGRIGFGLMYPDYVAVCGARVAFVAGGDRYAVHGKSIVLGGGDVSRDPSRSWVSPSCSADGRTLVAGAGANRRWELMGNEHRSLWRLLPSRRRLTTSPPGWTDEAPHLLADGSILFVRTRQVPRGNDAVTERGTLELLRGRSLTALADVTYTTAAGNYYGHYEWPQRVAASG